MRTRNVGQTLADGAWTSHCDRIRVGVRRACASAGLTFAEATIGKRIGKPDWPYGQIPYRDFTASLVPCRITGDGSFTSMTQGSSESRCETATTCT